MSLERELQKRSGHKCELCTSDENLNIYTIPPTPKKATINQVVYLCSTCSKQIDTKEYDLNHWRCLNDSMWSEHASVQVMAWRVLNKIKHEGWPQDLLDMLYLDEETLAWAKEGNEDSDSENTLKHKDSNGVILQAGDSVVLIKDLPVKGSSMVAKRGTAVRRISLDHENETYIEGKVNGQHIVILTQYVKKL